jgi:hypothetical protein
MEDFIKQLADAPSEKRIQAINERLKVLLAQSESERIETLKGLVMSVSELPESKKAQFISDRTLCISQLPTNQIATLMASRAKLSSLIPTDVNEADMKQTFIVLRHWPEEKRETFIHEIKHAYEIANVKFPEMEAAMS